MPAQVTFIVHLLAELDHINSIIKNQKVSVPSRFDKIADRAIHCTAVLFDASAVHHTDLRTVVQKYVSVAGLDCCIWNIEFLFKLQASIRRITAHNKYGLPGTRIGWLATKNRQILNDCAAFKDYTTLCNNAYAKDENGKPLAYLRIKDENILATPIHLRVWQQSDSPRGELIRYTEREQLLLDQLEQGNLLSLNRYCRRTGLSRRAAEHLLAKFVRYDIVEPVFENHKFYFRIKNE